MRTWTEILAELDQSARERGGSPDFDGVRRKYLARIAAHTGRNTILYAAKFTQPIMGRAGTFAAISDEDTQALMTVVHGISGPDLDLILHSPGGSLSATEALVHYLRSKFRHIRVVVPQLAMSAATMLACAGDVILMGKHSSLGPVDTQLTINTKLGPRMVAVQSILEQFELAKEECQDPKKLGAWLPQLEQFGPDLLIECRHASDLSEKLVREWLGSYMFRRFPDGQVRARRIAKWLSDHKVWKSHDRKIPREELRKHGLRIEKLESDPEAQDLFLAIFHATTHTFEGTPAVKIVENHLGKAFIRQLLIAPPPRISRPSDAEPGVGMEKPAPPAQPELPDPKA